MRFAPLPLLLMLAACAASGTDAPVFIDDFIARSTPTHCTPVPSLSAREAMIAEVATISDTSFLVLYDQDREVAVVGPDLEVRHLIRFAADGPTGVRSPTGMALLGDTLLYLADQSGRRLKRLDLEGRDRGTIQLDFAPQRLYASGDRLWITPFVVIRHPRSLLFELEGDQVREWPIPTVHFANPGINSIANMIHLAVYPDGRMITAHPIIVPFAQVLGAEAPDPTRRLALPLPDGVRSRYGKLPGPNAAEEHLGELLVAAIAATPDYRSGDLIYLTKTGRQSAGRSEKALIRTDGELRFLRSYLLDVNAMKLAYLAGQDLSLVTDEADQWYQCPTP